MCGEYHGSGRGGGSFLTYHSGELWVCKAESIRMDISDGSNIVPMNVGGSIL